MQTLSDKVLKSPLPLFMHLFFCLCPWGIARQGQDPSCCFGSTILAA